MKKETIDFNSQFKKEIINKAINSKKIYKNDIFIGTEFTMKDGSLVFLKSHNQYKDNYRGFDLGKYDIVYNSMDLNDYMYFTGIASINHYGCDWHRTTVDYNCVFPKEIRSWTNYGICGNKANPIRAYLDYLYYNIKFLGRVPNMKIDMFGFSEQQERKIKEKIESLLKPALSDNKEKLELFKLYKQYLNGGKYDFRSKSYAERKTRREALKTH